MRSGKALSCTIIVSLSLVLTLIWSCPAGASITAIGDIEPAYDGSDPWMLWTIMRVGTTADANLVVSGGSQIRSPNYMVPMSIGLAWESGVTASLTVTGPGSLVNASTTTGIAGNASLLVADGATLSGLDAVLGQNAGSTGLATVTGTGSLWENQRNLEIGRGGDGTVTVANGGMLTSAGAYLGFNAGSVGRVTVTGPNSVWESLPAVDGGDINIGWFGDGSVTVADGARVTTIETGTELALWQPGATGTLTVTGPNSLWETELVTIGGRGNATVNIFDGGRLVSETVYSAGNDGSTATISVSGPGSLLEADEYLAVAGEGQADMVISNSGRVHSGWSEVAQWEPSVGTVTVTGPNSVWEAGDSLTLGVHGDASMVVADGGRVISRVTHVAAEAESDSTVLVTGSGSRWENSDTLFLGDRGIGAMTVADGGSLITSHVVVGGQAGSVGNLLVTGPGTTLQAAPAPGIPGAPSDGNTPETYLLTTIGRDGPGHGGRRLALSGLLRGWCRQSHRDGSELRLGRRRLDSGG
jgi:fibronectin-binding autotransporter adhesin